MAFDTSTPYSTMMSYLELADKYRESDPALSDYYAGQATTWSSLIEQTTPQVDEKEAEKKVVEIYEQELGREPDQGGLDFYIDQLVNGTPIEQVQAQINASNEGSSFDQGVRDLVAETVGRVNVNNFYDAYKTAIDSGYTENQFFDAIGAKTVTDTTGKELISFTPNAPLTQDQKNLDAVKSLFSTELGRTPDIEGLTFYLNKLESGVPLEQIKAEIDASEEGARFDSQLQQLINTQYGGFGGANSQEIVNALSDQGYSLAQIADAIGADITTNEKGETTMSYTPPAAPAKTFTNAEVQKLITDQFGSVTPDNFQKVVDTVVGAGVPVDQFASVVGANISTNDAGQTRLTLPAPETQPMSLVDQLKAQQQVTGITHQASFSKDQDKIIADMAEKLGKYGVKDLADLKPITGEIEYQLDERMDDGEPTGVFNLMQRGIGPEGEETLVYAGRIATPDEINQIRTKGTVTENVGVLNARTGEEIPVNKLNNAAGSGFTYYKIEFSPDGIAVPYGYKEATGAGALGNQIKSIASLPPVAAALAAVTFGTLNTQGPGMFELGLSKPAASALAAFTSTAVGTGDLGKAAQAAILAGGSTYALQEAGLIKPGVTKPLEELTLSDFEGSGTGFGDTTDISPSDIRNILNQTSGPTLDSLSQVNPITSAAANLEIPIYGQGSQLAGAVPAGGISALGQGLQPKVEVVGQRDTGGQTAGAATALTNGQTILDKGDIQITGQGTKLDANTPASLSNILASNYTPPGSTDYTVNVKGTKLDAGTPGSAAAAAATATTKTSATKTIQQLASGEKDIKDLTSDEIEALLKAGFTASLLLGGGAESPTIPTTNVDIEGINTRRTGFTPDLTPTIPPRSTTTTTTGTTTPGQQVYTNLGINTGIPTTSPPATPTTGIGSLPVPTYKPPPFLGAQAPGASRITPPVLTADPTLTQADFDFAAAEIARQQAALPPIVQQPPATPFESGLAKGTTVAKRAGGIVALRGGGMPLAFMGGGMTGPVNQPRMLSGGGDGMSDSIPATINGTQPARLADGEFVIPADVVSDIGNGSSKAGAKELYAMMDRVRQSRHGTTKQPPEVNMNKVLPV